VGFIKKDKITTIFLVLLLPWFLKENLIFSRSIHRKYNSKIPCIESNWVKKKSKSYFLRSSYLAKDPIFTIFDKKFFNDHMLPDVINFRYDKSKYVKNKTLSKLIEHVIEEIKQKKRKFTHFTILRRSDFNRRKKSGLIILKFKKYPFVVKIFMEKPKSFARPYSKGLYPKFFFVMGSGVNRHLMGFTRIKNLLKIQKLISADPYWSKQIETPRKWFWLPKNAKEIELVGTNIIKNRKIKTVIPGTYCIIADAIELKNKTFSIFNKSARQKCMKLCNFLSIAVDPHIDNFLLEKNSEKIVIVDTEHFPTLVGYKDLQSFNGYTSWIAQLTKKCIGDLFLRSKANRKI